MATDCTTSIPATIAAIDWQQVRELASWSILPLVRLGVLVAIGAILFRARIMTKPAIDALSRLTVALLLPSFIASSILTQFRPGMVLYHGWYFLPISAMVMIGAFALMTYPIAHTARGWLHPRYTVATLSFHNAGYLAIPIVTELYARGPLKDYQGTMLALLFLFIMGISPLMWSLGVAAFRERPAKGEALWRKAFSPPFVASIASVLACLLSIPELLQPETLTQMLSPFTMLGACTVPLMMLILGATLMQLDHSYRPPVWLSVAALSLRLAIFPGIMFGVLSLLMQWDIIARSKAIILFVESAMPTAVAMAVIAHRYGSERAAHAVSGLIFLQYVFAAVTLPIWLTLWGAIYGYAVT